ncbi:MAG TPA: hypothetical protein ENK32_07950 [Anaerolineae bacterium]|nr:hypothetical protein [Anaerolineae bacterium]
MLSALQHAWDHHLQNSNVVLALCGSQVTTMDAIMQHQSPLFGRFTGPWHLQPLPFSSRRHQAGAASFAPFSLTVYYTPQV